jgi:HK97 family phage major capsid protein
VPYSNITSRSDAQALIPEDVAASIIKRTVEQSAALSLFGHVPMSRNQQRMPVMNALPVAYWVNGDTGLKQTTEAGWGNKFLNVEELAAIVPVPQAVLDDTEWDIWTEIEPFLTEAIGRTLDAAVFFGTNIPASWPQAIVPAATAAGNVVTEGTATAAQGGIAGDISALFASVEDDGYDVNGVVAHRAFKGKLRNARASTGESLVGINGQVTDAAIYGVDVTYPLRGLWPTGAGAAEMVAGDFTEGLIGIRQDITVTRHDEGVVQDNTGAIQFNLLQQDMVALRVVARFAFQVKQTPTLEKATPYPFGVLHAA